MKLFRFLLFPFAILYNIVTTIRNLLFDVGFFKENSFKTPVIVVGNLSVGGTGKTPQIEYLIRLLSSNYKIAVLSRGYKRKTSGFIEVNPTHTAEEVGDEPLQFFKKFKNISVAVCADRVEGIQSLKKNINPQIVLLDDAFQHRSVRGSVSILLTKYSDLFIDDYLIPTGNLRESRSGAKRATAIVVTKCPYDFSVSAQKVIKNRLEKYKKKVFFTSISYASKTKGAYEISIEDLQNYEVLLVTGIANPSSMLSFLSAKNIQFKHLKFSDHHHFSSNDIRTITQSYQQLKGEKKVVVTTEKDFVRLQNRLSHLVYLEIETAFLNNTASDFNTLVTKLL
ncbi:tetraacyldisaccharide 4'-kinase [Polaribacter tangerinus]|uniref:tetraacyldisaccharide 4'-kinase n=1 Tax=Polaribacter tangerinus TaxID=1920034 RepID=UPI000B4BAEC7|nr:tetraacyldisaccharide 4'-kinase [Polaribacter tangerinus]